METVVPEAEKLPAEYEAVHISSENLVTEVLKRAEDGEGDIIRFYECWNRRTTAELVFDRQYRKISLCNMLEEEENIRNFYEKAKRHCIENYSHYDAFSFLHKRSMINKKKLD